MNYVIVTADVFPFCLTVFFVFYHPVAIVYELYEVANTVNAKSINENSMKLCDYYFIVS